MVARTLALLDSRDWGPIDHRHLVNALSGWIDGQDYADGTLGAWAQPALQGKRTRSGRHPSDGV